MRRMLAGPRLMFLVLWVLSIIFDGPFWLDCLLLLFGICELAFRND